MTIEKTVPTLDQLSIKIFSDGADLDSIIETYQKGFAKGFTTNPTLMCRAGITSYMTFAEEVLRVIKDLPVSFEVFSDDLAGMEYQAMKLADLAENVHVKIPITNTQRESCCPLIAKLAQRGIKLNITAILTMEQVHEVADALQPDVPAFVSVFAGRIADTGRDPIPYMVASLERLKSLPAAELLWASPREVLNIMQADRIGCHIITVTPDILAKAAKFNMSLEDLSLDTVKMFYNDATRSGFTIA
ncbi:MAG: transaldolase [Kiritimatiellae bacterium]|nr:transaldolase [Kiritimatiellia bacterium]